ncbi:hypothetical protein V5799_011847 [Amblyomma americanum]|uniref:Uncharacterized protein n=1 Tax=Amblyomma americanum TaxID=6943 RepID=A0AAQ4EG58_AMBAM
MRQMCPGFPSELQLRECAEPCHLDQDCCTACFLCCSARSGLASRWKQTLGYHLLPKPASASSARSPEFADLIKDITFCAIRKCEALGLTVHALVTDLSTVSLFVWRQCGVSTRPVRRPVFSTLHPCATEQEVNDRRLLILADVPHVTKSIVDTLIENEAILLPRDVVEKRGLPSEKVCFNHIRSLFAKDAAENLGFVSGVSVDCLGSECMQKDVSIAAAVVSRGTVTGLRCLRMVNLLPVEAEATAWFVEQLDHWCSLMTSPSLGATEEQCKEAIAFMHEFKDTLSRISLPLQTQEEVQLWPAKIGLCISTLATLQLRETFAAGGNFKNCVFLGRRTSALLENVLGANGPVRCVPSLSDFRLSLHGMALAQLFLHIQNGSLSVDDSADVAEFISLKPSEDADDGSVFVGSEKSIESTVS